MSITLTLTDLQRCEAVNRAMLSPMVAPSITDWKAEVCRTLGELLQCRCCLFGLPGEQPYFWGTGMDQTVLHRFESYVGSAAGAPGSSPDPVVNRVFLERRRRGEEVLSDQMVREWIGPGGESSNFFQEVLQPLGIVRFFSLHFDTPAGDVIVAALFDRTERPRFDEQSVVLLRALLPALKAGIETCQRAQTYRFSLDVVRDPVVVFDAAGREIHRNEAVLRILNDDPEQERIAGEIQALASRLAPLVMPLHKTSGHIPFSPITRTVNTRRATYTLTATLLAYSGSKRDPGIFISLVAQSPKTLPQPEEIRSRFSLTRREAEIALLLAEGLSNDDIAGKLFLSPHTAKRHTENIFGKMGLNTRKALALRLIQGAQA